PPVRSSSGGEGCEMIYFIVYKRGAVGGRSLRVLAEPRALELDRFLARAVDLCEQAHGVLHRPVARRDPPEAEEEHRDRCGHRAALRGHRRLRGTLDEVGEVRDGYEDRDTDSEDEDDRPEHDEDDPSVHRSRGARN